MHVQVISSPDLLIRNPSENQIPKGVTWAVVGISVIPLLMILGGVEFGSENHSFNESILFENGAPVTTEAAFRHLTGAFTHTILEWSAFCVVIFTVCLAFNHYHITRDVTTPVIGVALVCAGFMDAFHTLAADRLITTVADIRNLIPFTWPICRVFNALIVIVAVGLLLIRANQPAWSNLRFVIAVSACFGVVAYAGIQYCPINPNLPQTLYPDALITRPWDFAPLLLYLFCGLYLFPLLYRKNPSIFTHSLIISVIPQVAVEAHMAFGSSALFDSHFNIAHFLKIVANLVPLIGLLLDHTDTHRKQKTTLSILDQAKTELERTRSRLAYLMRTSPAVIYSMDLSNQFKPTFINENIGDLVGYSTTEMMLDKFWKSHIHPEDKSKVLTKLNGLLEHREKSYSLEYRFQHRQGHYIWIHDSATISYDHSEQPLESIGSWTDISELKLKEAELIRANEELDQFAYIASHDLKEPLRGIHNYSNFLLEDYVDTLDQDGRSKLETLTRLSQRMEDLINSLLEYSRVGRVDLSFKNTNLNDTLRTVLDSLSVSLEHHNIDVRVPNPLPTIRCDSIRIGEVFSNLITNAMKYNDKLEKWIEIGYRMNGQTEDQQSTNKSNHQEGDPFTFYIRDNGIGMREKHLDSIFRIFKRLHGRDKFGGGTGVGLTIVKKVIERHNGKIWVDSCIGEGTTFYFTLSEGDLNDPSEPHNN